jgi:hypothetical protein
MKKTLDRYFPEVAEGIDCRMRVFVPGSPEESMIVLVSWIPRPPAELLEPFLSQMTSGFREGVVHLGRERGLENFSLVEYHALPAGERIGLILFGEQPDKPHFWHPIERDLIEELIEESLDAPLDQEIVRVPDSQEWQPQIESGSLVALAT